MELAFQKVINQRQERRRRKEENPKIKNNINKGSKLRMNCSTGSDCRYERSSQRQTKLQRCIEAKEFNLRVTESSYPRDIVEILFWH